MSTDSAFRQMADTIVRDHFKAVLADCTVAVSLRKAIETALADAWALGRDAAAAEREDEWRCFHCDEVFTDHVAAATHFGGHCMSLAACQIKADEGGLVALIRKQEDELDRFRSEETASYREFYSLGADHTMKLVSAEEDGYAKGLADGRAERADLAQLMAVACPMCNSRWPKIIAGPNGEQVLHQSPETKEYYACAAVPSKENG